MGLGVWQPANAKDGVPGTVVLIDETAHTNVKNEDVVLVPHPSTSPNDPLNWPTWKRDLVVFSISLAIGLGGVQGTFLSVATADIAQELKLSIIHSEYLSTYQFLSCGAASAVSAILARALGKRPVYLVSIILMFASALWNGAATTYGSLLGSRLLYGAGLGAFEAIGLSTVGDLYFVHQRGRRIAFYNFMGLGCDQISPVLGGYITSRYGWRMQAWILSAFLGFAMLLIFFACPETTFSRSRNLETDVLAPVNVFASDSPIDHENPKSNFTVIDKDSNDAEKCSSTDSKEKKRPYLKELLPFQKIGPSPNLVALIVRLATCALYPAVWYTFIIISTYLAWFVCISVVLAQVFAAPPILFGPTQLGYINTFCFPAAILATLMMHLLADRSALWLARKNHNVYEPEFRLILMVPAAITTAIAFPIFGWYTGTVSHSHEISEFATSAIYAVIIFSVLNATSVAYSYLLDAHRDISVEAAVFAVTARNFFTYGAATFTPLWLESDGVSTTFYAIAGLQTGLVVLLTALFWTCGKQMRAMIHRHDPMRWLGVQVVHHHNE